MKEVEDRPFSDRQVYKIVSSFVFHATKGGFPLALVPRQIIHLVNVKFVKFFDTYVIERPWKHR